MNIATRRLFPPTGDLVRGLLPRHEVSIFSGASGSGKTTLILQLLAAVQHHEPFFAFPAVEETPKVALICNDRSLRTTLELADRAGADLDLCHLQSVVDHRQIDVGRLRTDPFGLLLLLLKQAVEQQATWIIVDPLVVFFGADTKLYGPNAVALIMLNRMCQDHHFTLLGTHHATKARTDYGFKRRQDRIGGSGGALQGYSSTQLFLDTPEEAGGPHSILRIMHHLYPERDLALVRNEAGIFVPAPTEEATTPPAEPPSLAAFADTLLQVVPTDQEVSRAFFVEHFPSASPTTVDRALRALVEQAALVRIRHGAYRRSSSLP